MNTKGLLGTMLGLALGAGLTVATWAAPAVSEKGTAPISIIVSTPFYWDCADQQVTQIITGTYNYHSVKTPNGKTLYHELWFKNITGLVYGANGTIWIRTGIVSPFIEHRNADGTLRMMQLIYKGEFVSVSGSSPSIKVWEIYHVTFDANGELRIELVESRCG